MDEGFWHIRRRNESWAAGDYPQAWRENLILERFFAPVLDSPSYAAARGSRWPAEQRDDAKNRGAATLSAFTSRAEPYSIITWPRAVFWCLASGLTLSTAALGFLAERKKRARAPLVQMLR